MPRNHNRPSPPQPEDLPLSRDQEQAVAELARLDFDADVDVVIELVETLITKDRYQAAFDLVSSHISQPQQVDPVRLVYLSQTAARLVGSSCYPAGDKQIPRFNKLANNRLAGWAVLCHQQFLNLPLASFDQLAKRLVREWLGQVEGYSALYHRAGHLLGVAQFKAGQHVLEKTPVRQREARLAADLAAENDGLFASGRRLQKYGVKSAYVADGSRLPIVDWHIHDVAQKTRQAGVDTDLVADASISRSRARFTGFLCQLANQPAVFKILDEQDSGQVWSTKYPGVVNGQIRPVDGDLVCDIWQDGQIHLGGGTSLDWFAGELDLKLQYEMVRSRILSLYVDLVVPAYIIDDSDEIKVAENQAAQAGRAKARDFGQLVLARRRITDNPDIEGLIAKAEKEEAKRKRVVSRHGVVGFIRRLPAGWRASQAQRDLCLRDQGIELPPTGETYVRDHVRGGKNSPDDEPVAHRARLRHIGGSIIARAKDEDQDRPPARLTLPGL